MDLPTLQEQDIIRCLVEKANMLERNWKPKLQESISVVEPGKEVTLQEVQDLHNFASFLEKEVPELQDLKKRVLEAPKESRVLSEEDRKDIQSMADQIANEAILLKHISDKLKMCAVVEGIKIAPKCLTPNESNELETAIKNLANFQPLKERLKTLLLKYNALASSFTPSTEFTELPTMGIEITSFPNITEHEKEVIQSLIDRAHFLEKNLKPKIQGVASGFGPNKFINSNDAMELMRFSTLILREVDELQALQRKISMVSDQMIMLKENVLQDINALVGKMQSSANDLHKIATHFTSLVEKAGGIAPSGFVLTLQDARKIQSIIDSFSNFEGLKENIQSLVDKNKLTSSTLFTEHEKEIIQSLIDRAYFLQISLKPKIQAVGSGIGTGKVINSYDADEIWKLANLVEKEIQELRKMKQKVTRLPPNSKLIGIEEKRELQSLVDKVIFDAPLFTQLAVKMKNILDQEGGVAIAPRCFSQEEARELESMIDKIAQFYQLERKIQSIVDKSKNLEQYHQTISDFPTGYEKSAIQALVDKAHFLQYHLKPLIQSTATLIGPGALVTGADAESLCAFSDRLNSFVLDLNELKRRVFSVPPEQRILNEEDRREIQSLADKVNSEASRLQQISTKFLNCTMKQGGITTVPRCLSQEEAKELESIIDKLAHFEGLKERIQSITDKHSTLKTSTKMAATSPEANVPSMSIRR